MLDYNELLEELRGGMQRYVENGIEPGSFLKAVLRNDLQSAVGAADEWNLYSLPAIVRWCYWELPANLWGNVENYDKHIKEVQL